jgi:hypothetical protein
MPVHAQSFMGLASAPDGGVVKAVDQGPVRYLHDP